MIRQRSKAHEGQRDPSRGHLLPLRSSKNQQPCTVSLWLLGSLGLIVLSTYCTYSFYPSSLNTQYQILGGVRRRQDEINVGVGPARKRSLEDRLQKRHLAWLMSFPNSVRNVTNYRCVFMYTFAFLLLIQRLLGYFTPYTHRERPLHWPIWSMSRT
jgi:hypothetical protein